MSALPALGLVLCVAALGCEPTDRPSMNPGQDCVTCHVEGGQANRLRWTAAGTIYDQPTGADATGVAGAHVTLTDSHGTSVTLTTNESGNFYTAEDLDSDAGLHILVEYQGKCRPMLDTPKPAFTYQVIDGGYEPPATPMHGIGCNHCHTDPAPTVGTPSTQVVAPGHLAIPQWFEANNGGAFSCDGGPLSP